MTDFGHLVTDFFSHYQWFCTCKIRIWY